MREMKDSGIEWIGQIPSNWKIERMQWHLEEKNVGNNPVQTTNILSLTNKRGVIPYEEKGNQGNKSKEDVSGYKLAYPNTIVANSMNVIIGSVGLSKYYGCVSPVYYVFQATNNANIEFFNYIFSVVGFQRELRKYANGILEIRLRVSADNILKRPVAIPPDEEQARIVNFLNTKCSEIDAISADIQKEIETLEQYKRSVITEAVTKGLNPNTETKKSAIFYMAPYNSGWHLTKIGYECTKLARPFSPADMPLLCTNKGKVSPRPNNMTGKMVSEDNAMQGIHKGDIAIHGMDTWHGAIAMSEYDGKITRVVHVCDSKQDKRFIVYYLQQLAFNDVYKLISFGIRGNTSDFRSWDKVKDIYIALPDIDEQRKISDNLDLECRYVEDIVSEKKKQLDVLDAYKKSLIYEYVTGKKEVPTYES
ncbi:MAG: restriction endonuclease subunit S [Gemmiger sp.]